MRSVLLIDDDPSVLGFLEVAFRREGYAVTVALSGREGLESYTHNSTDLVVLDLNLPDLSGQEVLERMLSTDPDATVLMLTGQPDLETAVKAMRTGAENFLPKPVDLQHLRAASERAFEKLELRRRTRYLEMRAHAAEPVATPIAARGVMREMEEKIGLVSPMDTTVLILGETGTGKSWLARRIHELSPRAKGPFVEVNCAALTSTFLDSELFGHEKGAFTDAKMLKRGLIEVADGGTLFLDEIGDLAPELQPKLLTAVETRRFRRLGGTRDLESDVRLLAATNHDLRIAVNKGRFREDLYYRLAVMPILMPPLRERETADLIGLARDIASQLRRGFNAPAAPNSTGALALLTSYSWPGNIREMRNVIERAMILAGKGTVITPHHLPAELRSIVAHWPTSPAPEEDRTLTLAELEERHIRKVLEHCEGNRSEAARQLGISRVGLYKKLLRLDATLPSA